MTRRRLLLAALAVAVLAAVAGGGWLAWQRTHPSYCEVVAEHQTELAELTAEGGGGALFEALDVYRELRAAAPDDVQDDWDRVIGRLEVLEEAVEDAGVDPATYDAERPPAGLEAGERAAIEAAARELGAPPTLAAMGNLEQQALDVCHTPLSQ